MNMSRAFPAFSIGFGIVYLASMALHPMLTLFTYVPRTGVWMMGSQSSADLARNAPGMYWYSWLTTGLIAGVVFGVIALFASEDLRKKFWSGWVWVVPVALTVILSYLEWPWFAGAFKRMFS